MSEANRMSCMLIIEGRGHMLRDRRGHTDTQAGVYTRTPRGVHIFLIKMSAGVWRVAPLCASIARPAASGCGGKCSAAVWQAAGTSRTLLDARVQSGV